MYEEEKILPPTQREMIVLVWLFRGVLLAVLPCSVYMYRSRLLSLIVFTNIKMH